MSFPLVASGLLAFLCISVLWDCPPPLLLSTQEESKYQCISSEELKLKVETIQREIAKSEKAQDQMRYFQHRLDNMTKNQTLVNRKCSSVVLYGSSVQDAFDKHASLAMSVMSHCGLFMGTLHGDFSERLVYKNAAN